MHLLLLTTVIFLPPVYPSVILPQIQYISISLLNASPVISCLNQLSLLLIASETVKHCFVYVTQTLQVMYVCRSIFNFWKVHHLTGSYTQVMLPSMDTLQNFLLKVFDYVFHDLCMKCMHQNCSAYKKGNNTPNRRAVLGLIAIGGKGSQWQEQLMSMSIL